ncbi:MAG: hypothetical protein K1X64_01965 [Myxococcaceae bacterium]|nr:hypothetical protein [Myxococcaceae bacterium]
MKRSFPIVGTLIFVAFASCGKTSTGPCDPDGPLGDKPRLCTERDSIGFNQEFCSGTYIGTSVPQTFMIWNNGIEGLNISEVTLTGDPAFTMTGPTKTMLTGTKKEDRQAFVQLFFAPTQYKFYGNTKLTIKSNAENAPEKVIEISGRGCRAATADAGEMCPPFPPDAGMCSAM